MKTQFIFFYLLLISLASCVGTKESNKKDIAIHWKQQANDVNDKHESFAELTIKNVGSTQLNKSNWALYFNNKPCTQLDVAKAGSDVSIERINGDFFKITPKKSFKGLNSGDSIVVSLYTNSPVIKYTDRAVGFYFVFDKNGKEEFYEPAYSYGSLSPEMAQMSKSDTYVVETNEIRFEENKQLSKIALSTKDKIIPTPLNVTETKGVFDVSKIKEIVADKNTQPQAQLLKEYIKSTLNQEVVIVDKASTPSAIQLIKKEINSNTEAYSLTIKSSGIEITGSNKGLVYGIQTLRGLLPLKGESNAIQCAKIIDQPRFEYRGFMLDVARNFQTKESILNLLDVMGFYKMNKLHFHLTDDEGWRIDLKKFPELVEVGSSRKHPTDKFSTIPSYGSGPRGTEGISNGYYTRADYIEILQYAKARNIEVIPEVDVPGHARIAINAMRLRSDRLKTQEKLKEANEFTLDDPEDASEYSSVQGFNDNTICPCENSSYNFIDALIGEFNDIYTEAGVPLETMHLGGDEVAHGVWEKSPSCKEFMKENNLEDIEALKGYYALRIAKIAKRNNVKLQLWDDILHHAKGMSPENLTLNAWDNTWGAGTEDFGYKRANEGYNVIMTSVSSLYFDMAYTKEVDEPGFYWGDYNNTRNIFNYLPTNLFSTDHKLRLGGIITKEELSSKETLTPKGLKHIKGIQGALWSETLKGQQDAEYLLYPKMLALAERAWSTSIVKRGDSKKKIGERLNQDWNVFANAIGQREFNRLASWKRHFRIPPVGAIVKDGKVEANTAFPGLTVRYASTSDTLDENSKIYTTPIPLTEALQFAAFDKYGNKGRIQIISSSKKSI
ncbi:family 20 glycosylhydrolase [Flammeovirga kamogawensis]|uniref:beta-N-acetylhexosaminidase n=1 Tax=Flammeovirga kamogawensis TaxID=373891 RepID=A0ABX8GY96_9BACT|nr:family 20 glycosylhydrolase [Flammeovirga kamogawensis]MBB6458940.1 hexosaminidase [Flammeovirga kamogawensis]QWG08516.1 carbohydate-binding domain-containing protein [Flammeovirga kamogawensis]TRX66809.1 family 20 glycosylhydrolase [Flammeovirga kamogawensis]